MFIKLLPINIKASQEIKLPVWNLEPISDHHSDNSILPLLEFIHVYSNQASPLVGPRLLLEQPVYVSQGAIYDHILRQGSRVKISKTHL